MPRKAKLRTKPVPSLRAALRARIISPGLVPMASPYAIADAIAGAVKLGVPQTAAAYYARYVCEKFGPMETGALLTKILFYRAHPPTEN